MGSFRAVSANAKSDILQDVGLVGFWECNFATGEIAVAPELCRYYGVCIDGDRVPVFADFLARVHPDDIGLAGPERLKSLDKDGVSVVKYRVIDEGGTTRWVLCRAIMTLDADGQLLSGRGLAFDITASERAHERSLSEPPERVMADRVAELLLEAHRLAGLIRDPSLSSALSLSLHVAGRVLSRGLRNSLDQRHRS